MLTKVFGRVEAGG